MFKKTIKIKVTVKLYDLRLVKTIVKGMYVGNIYVA